MLQALEDEHFDLLPERVYAIGFLRTYAHYLGLDAQLFVDDLSSRLPLEEGFEVLLPPQGVRRRRALGPWILAAASIAAAAGVVIGLIGFGGSKKHTKSSPAPTVQASPPPTVREAPPVATPPAQHQVKQRIATLVLTAAHGRCWLDARLGSPDGRELHMGTLELGQSIRLRGRRLWIRLGAPTALEATLNGTAAVLPSVTPVNVVVTPAGVRETSRNR